MFSQRNTKDRKLLDADLKHKLLYYFKNLVPIIKSSQSVAGGYQPKIVQLNQRVRDENVRYDVQQFLQNYIVEQSLIEETHHQTFYLKLTHAL